MDRDNFNDMVDVAVMDGTARVQLFLEFASDLDATDVPDPYYGGESGFDHVLDLIEAASEGLIAHIRARHL
jgi:protein-tyrosine phosphatase